MKYIYSLLIASIILFSCKKDETIPQPPPIVTPTSDTTITVGNTKFYFMTIGGGDWVHNLANDYWEATINTPVLTDAILPYCKVEGAILAENEWNVLPWYVWNKLDTDNSGEYTLNWISYSLSYGAGYVKITLYKNRNMGIRSSYYNIKARIAVSL